VAWFRFTENPKMKNPNPLERDIEKAVVAYAQKLGILCYKFTSPARRSVPDRMFITTSGVVFFIEFKRRGEKPTKSQAVEIERIRKQRVKVFVIDDVTAGRCAVCDMFHLVTLNDPMF